MGAPSGSRSRCSRSPTGRQSSAGLRRGARRRPRPRGRRQRDATRHPVRLPHSLGDDVDRPTRPRGLGRAARRATTRVTRSRSPWSTSPCTGLNGVNLATAIHNDSSLAARLVLMTEERDAVRPRPRWSRRFLSKPIHREDLRTSLRRALDVSRDPLSFERRSRLARPTRRTRNRPAARGRGQPDQPDGSGRDPLEGRLLRGHGAERLRSSPGGRQPGLRRHPDGLPHAPDERLRGDGGHTSPRRHHPPHPDHCADCQARRGPGALPGGGHRRVPLQAGPQGTPARDGAAVDPAPGATGDPPGGRSRASLRHAARARPAMARDRRACVRSAPRGAGAGR